MASDPVMSVRETDEFDSTGLMYPSSVNVLEAVTVVPRLSVTLTDTAFVVTALAVNVYDPVRPDNVSVCVDPANVIFALASSEYCDVVSNEIGRLMFVRVRIASLAPW